MIAAADARTLIRLVANLTPNPGALASFLSELAVELAPPEPDHPFLAAMGAWSRDHYRPGARS